MSSPTPTPRPSRESPAYTVALLVGASALIVGAVVGILLYLVGGRELAITGIAIALIAYTVVYAIVLRDAAPP